jgi:hypothetical protein
VSEPGRPATEPEDVLEVPLVPLLDGVLAVAFAFSVAALWIKCDRVEVDAVSSMFISSYLLDCRNCRMPALQMLRAIVRSRPAGLSEVAVPPGTKAAAGRANAVHPDGDLATFPRA